MNLVKHAFTLTVAMLVLAIAAGCAGESAPAGQSSESIGESASAGQTDAKTDTQNNMEKPALTAEEFITMALQSAKEAGIPDEDIVHYDVLANQYPDHAHGIDVSHHQGDVDWSMVKNVGIDFVYLKATEGIDYQDPMFERNWRAAGEAGLLRGAYHMYRPEDKAYEQIRNFVETLSAVGVDEHMLPPVLDIERVRTVDSISREVLHERAVLWLKSVADELGVRPLVYTNPTFWKGYLRGDHELTDFMLWISEYKLDATDPESTGAWKEWTFWQFSRYGIVPGVPKPVDLNRFFDNPAKLTTIRIAAE